MVTRLRYGNTNTFLIHGTNGNLLVDTDMAGTLPAFYKAIKQSGIRVGDITYVLTTHYHPDHMGLVSELMKQGVQLLLMDVQIPYVHYSDAIFAREQRLAYEPIRETDATVISCEESRGFLKKLGIDGEICSIPSHSADCVALFLDEGSCFVGDLEPIEYLDGYEENPQLSADWELVLENEPKTVFYAHSPATLF
ncbi:MAG: MBL fold metallo-hydrolase [Oscillospiraceae bacterium]|nr:MBL fold metallo-hydrolase [Oscillospiraceae bacterium]